MTFSFSRSQEWLIDPSEPPQVRNRTLELKRSQSADEMATIDYDMFEQRRGSAENAVRGELGRDGYMRMKQTSRDRVDVADGGFPMGTADVAIGGIEPPDAHIYDMAEQEITFTTDNGVYRREQWSAVGEGGPGQLTEEGFREIHVENESPYAEISFDGEVGKHFCSMHKVLRWRKADICHERFLLVVGGGRFGFRIFQLLASSDLKHSLIIQCLHGAGILFVFLISICILAQK